MNKKKLCRYIALVLALLSIILAVVLLLWGERGSIFVALVLLLLARFIDTMGQDRN